MHQAAYQVILALADPVPVMKYLLFVRGEGVSVDTNTLLEDYMLPLAQVARQTTVSAPALGRGFFMSA